VKRLVRLMAVTAIVVWPALTAASPCESLQVARWLLGDWVASGEKSQFHESWSELGPRTYEGIGSEHTTSDGNITGTESLRLVEMAGGVYYVAKVSHNELPVAFRLNECGADRLVFENSAHDFPRRLEYRHGADDRMIVSVSDGADQGFTLELVRRAAGTEAGALVLSAEDARFGAMVNADTAELGSWLADDLQYVHSTGQVESREQFLDSIASGRIRYLAIEPTERQVVSLDDAAAIVRGRGRFQVMAGENRFDLPIRYLAVYGQSAGRWRLRSWQSLRLTL